MSNKQQGKELSDHERANIYRLYKHKDWTLKALATRYGKGVETIRRVVRKKEEEYAD